MDKGKKQDFTGAELLEVKKSRKADLEQNRSVKVFSFLDEDADYLYGGFAILD